MKYQFNKLNIGLLVLLFWLSGHSIAFAAVEGPEPNNDCATAQDLGEIALPFNLSDNLDGAVTPDVDYYKITGTPGSAIEIQLKGADSSSGTLTDPHLGVLNSDCVITQFGGDVSVQNRDDKIRSRFPGNGVLYLATSQCCDNFDLGGNGTYQLLVQSVNTVNSISFNVTDAKTGQSIDDQSGFQYNISIGTPDGNSLFYEVTGTGEFKAISDHRGQPLVPGNYSVLINATNPFFFNQYEEYDSTFSVPATQDYSTEFKLQSITRFSATLSGRVVDAITGQPLVTDSANPFQSLLLVAAQSDTGGFLGESLASTDQDGKFKFDNLFGGLRINTQLIVSADQYQTFSTSVNFTETNPNLDLGDIQMISNPVRFNNVIPCKKIPRKGGSCLYSLTVANGLSTKLNGEIWGIVETFGPNINRNVEFQPKLQELALKPGESRKVSFTFPLPSTVSDNTSVCAKAYVGKKPASMWDVVGFRDLFCITKGQMGYAVMPEHEMHKLIREHK